MPALNAEKIKVDLRKELKAYVDAEIKACVALLLAPRTHVRLVQRQSC
jgi:hypothetical protein